MTSVRRGFDAGREGCARYFRGGAWFVAVLMLCSSAAQAQPSEVAPAEAGPTETQRQQARAFMNEGERLFAAGDLEGALRSYTAGHEIMHVPTTGYEVAKVQALLGALVEANAVATEVVNHPVSSGEPPVFGQAREKAQKLMAELQQRIPKLVISVSPVGAQVFVDARQLTPEMLAAPYLVNPGKVALSARAAGHRDASTEVTLSERETRNVHLQLESLPAPVEPDVVAGTTDQGDEERLLRAYVGFGVGGLGLTVAGITGAMSISAAADAREFCDGDECTPEARDDIDSSKTLANVANVSFAIGLIGAGYGIYEYFFNEDSADAAPTESTEAGLRATPFIGVSPDGRDATIGVSGAF